MSLSRAVVFEIKGRIRKVLHSSLDFKLDLQGVADVHAYMICRAFLSQSIL